MAMVNKVNFAYYLQFLLSLLHGQSDQINLDFSNLNPKIVTTNTQLKAHMGGNYQLETTPFSSGKRLLCLPGRTEWPLMPNSTEHRPVRHLRAPPGFGR